MTTKSCLLVCDDPHDQAVFIQAISDAAPDTICFVAPDAADALFFLSTDRLIPNYIFIEFKMPQMTGLDFIKTVKQSEDLKSVPVIVHATSDQPVETIEALRQHGVMAIYSKPYEYHGIRKMLNLYFINEMSLAKYN